MWKKTTAVLMICILCISFSFPVSNAAEISGTASDVTNYKQISSLVSDTWESDYFEKMIISPGSDSMEKDGEGDSSSHNVLARPSASSMATILGTSSLTEFSLSS